MNKVKQQHYVPRSYLRRWANSRDQIWVFDKSTQQAFETHVKNVAQERYFYDINPELLKEPDDSQPGESLLQMIEDDFKEAVDELLGEAETVGIPPELRSRLALHIAVQFLRTAEMRNFVIQGSNAVLEQVRDDLMAERFPDLDPKESSVSLKPSAHSLMHARLLFNPGTLDRATAILEAHCWMLGINRSDNPLYTSDHPVAVREHIHEPFVSNAGIGSPGVEIAFPLTPKHVLILVERTHHPQCAPFDLKCFPLDERNVEHYNHLQVICSTRYVFSSTGDFESALRACAESPDLCDPDRQRITVSRVAPRSS